MNPADSWEERISGHWESRNSLMACNLEDNATKVCKPVGYLQIIMARTTHKFLSTGSDTSDLGHWFLTHNWGEYNITLQDITPYRPCITNSSGFQTTYRQHQHYLDITNDNRLPIQEIIEDLCMYISQWCDLGDHIVLMIDLNEKITSYTVTEIFVNVGLMEAINHCHCATGPVPTFQILSHPIYVIYASITLQLSYGGYLSFGTIPSYHHLLWLKNDFDSVFGTKIDTLVPHTARALNSQKPDTVKIYRIIRELR